MDFLQAIYSHLTKQKDITKIVDNKIYPMFIPQKESIPAITYYPVSTIYNSELGKDNKLVRCIVQFDCHDRTFKKARKLSRMVKNTFQNLQGDMSGIYVQATFIRSDIVLNTGNSNRVDTEDTIHIVEVEFFYNEK